MSYFTGIDIGSADIKIVVIDENDEIVARTVAPTGSKFNQNTEVELNPKNNITVSVDFVL